MFLKEVMTMLDFVHFPACALTGDLKFYKIILIDEKSDLLRDAHMGKIELQRGTRNSL